MNRYSVLCLGIGVSVILGVVILGFSDSNISKKVHSYDPQKLPFGLYSEHMSDIRAPPPMELSSLGEPFEVFLELDGATPLSADNAAMPYSTSIEPSEFEKLQDAGLIMIPSFIPEGLEIKKTLYSYSEDGFKDVILVMLPQTVDKDDVLTEIDMFNHNGIYILISYQDFVFESDEELEEWRDNIIDRGTSKRIEIDGWKGFEGHGDPQKGKESGIVLINNHVYLTLKSSAYDVSYLKQIVESMISEPM